MRQDLDIQKNTTQRKYSHWGLRAGVHKPTYRFSTGKLAVNLPRLKENSVK